MVLVSMVMLVLIAMYRASDPKFWSFMGFKDETAQQPADQQLDEPVNTQLRTEAPDGDDRPLDTISATPSLSMKLESGSDEADADELLHKNRLNGWSVALGQLNSSGNLRLRKLLLLARQGEPFPDEDQDALAEDLRTLHESWTTFNDSAAAEVAEKPAEVRPRWEQLVAKLRQQWADDQAALEFAVPGRARLERDQQNLANIQSLLDELALEEVRDNTVVNRWQEINAWFRMFDVLNTATAEELAAESAGNVSFLQLYRQPKHFRGKLVTIRGTAKSAKHVKAYDNIFGIEGYYIFVIKPAGGPDSPLTVYSLDAPPDFPLTPENPSGDDRVLLDEDVEFTGFFFKNAAYSSRDGIRVQPVLLAKYPQWHKEEVVSVELPKPVIIGLAVLGLALLATGIAVVVFLRHRRTPELVLQYGATNLRTPDRLKFLQGEDIPTNVGEGLQRFLDEAEEHQSKD